MRVPLSSVSLRLAVLSMAVAAGCSSSGPQSARTSSPAVEASGVTRVSEQNAAQVLNFPTGERGSSLLQVQQIAPAELRAGAPYTFKVLVKNLTDKSLQNVVLRATQPEGLKLAAPVDGTASLKPDDKGWLNYNVGTLAPRETREFSFTGTPTGATAIRQTYDVKFEQQMQTTLNVTAPAVSLVKAGPTDVDICEEIVWTYSVKNTGTGVVRNASLRDQLPEGLTTRDGQSFVAADLGDIPAGETRQAKASLKATRVGKFASAAMLQSQAGEAKSESVGLTVRQPRLDLAAKGPEQEYLGKVATYQVTVTNTGDSPARNVMLRLATPGDVQPVSVTDGEGASLASAAAPAGSQSLGTIEPGKSRTINVAFEPRAGGPFKLDASASAKCATEVAKAVETNILTVGALLLEAVDVQDPAKVGENVVYRIKVTNQGTGPDANVNVTATLPDGEEFVKAVGTTAGSGTGQTIHFAPIASLAAKQSVSWEVTAKAVKAGDVQFKVQATSDTVKAAAEKVETTKLY